MTKINYGNGKAGPEIDSFWLNGDLRISPLQQVDFLRCLVASELPLQAEYIGTVKRIMIANQGDRYILRAK